MKTNVTLSPENSARIAQYSQLIGWTPERLTNHLLAETLYLFEDLRSGSLEGFLGSIHFDDRQSAERVLALITEITRKQCDGQLPESFRAQIHTRADGRFDVKTSSRPIT